MGVNINRVVLSGNLTADPELKSLPSGNSVCNLRLACNSRRKNPATGEWEDKPNYVGIVVWGAQGENCARFLSKGSPCSIDGRLDWREWEKDGQKRSVIEVVADSVQFHNDGSGPSGGGGQSPQQQAQQAAQAAPEDEIPFLRDDDLGYEQRREHTSRW